MHFVWLSQKRSILMHRSGRKINNVLFHLTCSGHASALKKRWRFLLFRAQTCPLRLLSSMSLRSGWNQEHHFFGSCRQQCRLCVERKQETGKKTFQIRLRWTNLSSSVQPGSLSRVMEERVVSDGQCGGMTPQYDSPVPNTVRLQYINKGVQET